ncbi:PilN domain-containing protein [Candidatus Formimonas warabiya]|uniref:PilN domain-containing protein n=1 Tax=Formimonas warabiya TaxID=1761012 RepID=A0A3G1KNF8_FORW1|nr:PilN domain-containing protein [Candidatus Formimonas warabiya]ATW23999.1 hypothetical protein DCMF_03615 [Candidatus Formimonas warabiya]
MKKNINLLPVELQKKASVKTQRNLLMMLAGLIACTVLIVFTGFFAWIKICEYRLAHLDQSIATIMPKDALEKSYQQENLQMEKDLQNLEQIQEGRIDWTTILQDMNNHLPRDMWITGFSSQGGKVSITGLTADVSEIGVFIYELNQLAYFSDLSLGKTGEVTAGNLTLNEFSIVGTLVKGSE